MKLNLVEIFYEQSRGKCFFKKSVKEDKNGQPQIYYCLNSKNQISDPTEVIQMYIHYIDEEEKNIFKDKAIEIAINRRRYILSSDKELLVAVMMEWRLPHKCYQFFKRKKMHYNLF